MRNDAINTTGRLTVRFISLTAVFVSLFGSVALAQQFRLWQVVEFSKDVELPEADNVARSHLETIDRFLEAGQWDEAIESLRRLMDTDGDKLLPVGKASGGPAADFIRFVSLRDYCQMRLAAMHGSAENEALTLYRNRVDSLAQNWLQEGLTRSDPTQYRRILDRFFVSSSGDDALFHLGQWELARGNFAIARGAWARTDSLARKVALLSSDHARGGRMLDQFDSEKSENTDPSKTLRNWLAALPDPNPTLVYPDTDLNLADVLSRLTLVSILEGSTDRAELELKLLGRLFPEAEGVLAGRRGLYPDLLGQLLDQSRSWQAPLPPADWKTFGGSPARGKVAVEDIDIALRPIWTVPLPRSTPQQHWVDDAARPGEDRTGLLSYHPLVVGDNVLISTGTQLEDVQAYDLLTGKPRWPQSVPVNPIPKLPERDVQPGLPGILGSPVPSERHGVSRYTMTAHAERLYVKLGTQATSLVPNERFDPPPPGYLVALDLTAEKRRLFEIRIDPKTWGSGWAFEGAPLVDGEYLYVAMRRREALRNQAHVACFIMRRNRAELLWRTLVCSAESPSQGELDEYTHNLLTLDQGVLFLNTNLGVVAAVDGSDGHIRWLTRYPRAPLTGTDPNRSGRYLFRDLNPCLVYKDLVITAPSDCDRIFALNLSSGELAWDVGSGHAEDVVHLLGVGHGNLLASGDRLYWIDVASGQIRGRFPERVEGELRGYGRGVLAGDRVFWPTREQIFVLAQDGPRSLRQPIELAPIGMTGGNLVPAGQMLLVAGPDRLAAYNPWGR